MIDIRKLKELVRLMVANDLSELDLRDADQQVTLRREASITEVAPVVQAPVNAAAIAGVPAAAPACATATAIAEPPAGGEPDIDPSLHRIESPMVGTFYAAPNPDADSFVKVGQEITPDSVVCLVEAMKIFNEIKADCSGTIRKVLVENGEAIEFGQPLFLVRPD
jgi:acetyl-CoA carboxylase biotin carboxyl carrier protein